MTASAPQPATVAPRTREQRRRDTEHRLAHDVDLWVATASADGVPYLVPLSFEWDGETLLLATPAESPTGRNLASGRIVRLGLGHTRDVTMIEGEVEVLEIDALPRERADRFAARTGFDPRDEATPYRWFRVTPRRVQAWREADELPGRELMRDGRRLD
ncbi:pyridoxamine 5'-phosphate oxidase family protein [Actinomadura madurae]|uniref:pyridoxamine 5'-phosphate oxidase family protein n=1 Tax=Actinomadura madurae TaxID=1993 RepID=UPI0020D20702|nr:pyridoxamine 5'-phosphate oxidase family protein [Actinomadura madurae]MCP9952998.1 pyridoxamine 5'-phosphate oxidase family protein [Actinomadura madurae]MCP9969761.1 pyridoxamine 5'-phosphate oxidase family protein [Actinomadura madurae]MCP9982214.1 pyridoxamine 5'-phosphate oxidase family protein [Actinomadura madurae]MCQ0006259.1 pyridoxamine 5'-phosphate oxidase family protein [Actinomadura madurae]